MTIFGWSAGGLSVDGLIKTLPRDPPFRAAIMQSGSGTYNVPATARKLGLVAWEALVKSLNCSTAADVLTCVRAADAFRIKRLIEEAAAVVFPVIDNITQIADPARARAERRVADVPLIIGNTAQESRLRMTSMNITASLMEGFPSDPQLRAKIAAAYPIGLGGLDTPYDVISQWQTEYGNQCVSKLVPCCSFSPFCPSHPCGSPPWKTIDFQNLL